MPTTGPINGTLLKLTIGGTTINDLTGCNMSVSVDTREVTTKDSGGYQEILPTVTRIEYSGSIIVALDATYGAEELYDVVIAKTAVTAEFTTNVSGDVQFSQSTYATQWDISAPMEDNVTLDFTLVGTGQPTKSDVT